MGSNQSKLAREQGKLARARARARSGVFARRPLAIWKTREELATLFTCLTDICTKALAFLFLYDSSPRPGTGRTPGRSRVYSPAATCSDGAEHTDILTD